MNHFVIHMEMNIATTCTKGDRPTFKPVSHILKSSEKEKVIKIKNKIKLKTENGHKIAKV